VMVVQPCHELLPQFDFIKQSIQNFELVKSYCRRILLSMWIFIEQCGLDSGS
jgi:hypothetical protein